MDTRKDPRQDFAPGALIPASVAPEMVGTDQAAGISVEIGKIGRAHV